MDNIRRECFSRRSKLLFFNALNTYMYFYYIDVLGVVSDTFYIHDPGFELIIRYNGPVFDPCFVGIDRIDRILQDLGDLFIIADPHPDKGKDPQVDIQQFIFL